MERKLTHEFARLVFSHAKSWTRLAHIAPEGSRTRTNALRNALEDLRYALELRGRVRREATSVPPAVVARKRAVDF